MMTIEQIQTVKVVYNRLITSEEEDWSDIDDNLELCSYLNDQELVQEIRIKIEKHSKGIFRCVEEHPNSLCFAPLVLESAIAINELYEKTGELHIKNRYILMYYLALSEMKLFYTV